ncbi:MAG: hypothetical protein ACLU80_00445 [Dorea sp.]
MRGYTVEMSLLNANHYVAGHEQYLCIFYYHDKNISLREQPYETAVVGR